MFGNKLKELRINNQLSQEELGKILKTSGKNISSWERGITRPDIDTLKTLSEYFNVSADFLLSIQQNDDDEMQRLEYAFNEIGLQIPKDMTLEDLEKSLKMIDIMKGNK